METFNKYFIEVILKKYAKFSGRASRKEFLYFNLFYTLFGFLAYMADVALFYFTATSDSVSQTSIIEEVYLLLILLPASAIFIRRLHDHGKSALWLLILLVPIVGFFAFLYFGLKVGQDEENEYGPVEDIDDSADKPKKRTGSEEKPKSNKLIKIIGITILTILIIAGALFFVMGGAVLSMFKTIDLSANKSVISSITINGSKVSIHVPLMTQYSLVYPDITLCTPEDKKDDGFFNNIVADGYSTSYSCVNDQCKISIDIEDPKKYPKTIEVYTKDDKNSCKKKTIHMQEPEPAGYYATIEMTPKLLSRLNITDGEYDVKSQLSNGNESWQIMGTKKVKLSYDTPPTSDVLLINGEPQASIVFDDKQKDTNKSKKINAADQSADKKTNTNTSNDSMGLLDDIKTSTMSGLNSVANMITKQYESIRDKAMLMIDPEYKAPPSSVTEETDTIKKNIDTKKTKHVKPKKNLELEIKKLEKQIRELKNEKYKLTKELGQ